ncbi:unnamed protein product [Amoebophrya sp. A25]|nr:unnamed protein product [Amoebophrya sp. A25]|eukprot:GSA25T00025029001.1
MTLVHAIHSCSQNMKNYPAMLLSTSRSARIRASALCALEESRPTPSSPSCRWRPTVGLRLHKNGIISSANHAPHQQSLQHAGASPLSATLLRQYDNFNFSPPTSSVRAFSTRSIHGRMFWRRRPRDVPVRKWNWRSKWLEGRPHTKGICTKVTIKSPKKPNSGNRKVARVRLACGRTVWCYIPGIGHNLQTHSVVLVRGRRTPDLVGVNYKLVRGKFDLLPVKDKKRARSKYGVKRPMLTKRFVNDPKLPWRRVYTDEMRERYFYRTGVKIEAGEPVPYIPVHRKFPPFPIRGFGRKKAKA